MFVICLIELTPGIHISCSLVNTLLRIYEVQIWVLDSDSVFSPPQQTEYVQHVMCTCILAAETLFAIII